MAKIVLPLAEYPRPQLERNSYFCLNGTCLISIERPSKLTSN